jgi:alcohol dehydrogenase class IV
MEIDMFDFYLGTKVKFGCGTRQFVTEIIQREEWNRIGVVVDHNLLTLPIIKELIDQLRRSTDFLVVGKCTISEPTYEALEKMRPQFSDPTLQAVIGIGGGSALDMAKAMAVLVHNRKSAIEYRGFDRMTESVLPIIAIPTTAGTGSELTPNASFIDSLEKKKMGINGEAVRPRYALIDPELTLSCPKGPTISAAVDSLVHATEAYAAKKTNSIARLFAGEGFQRVFNVLPQLINDLENIDLRQEVMYGAFLSGIALMHSGTGPAAAMSYPLGVHYNVPHGLGGGIFLPYVVEHNISHGYVDYAGLYDKIEGDKINTTQDFLKRLLNLWEQLAISKDLSFCGMQKSGIDFFVKETMGLKGALDQNPVPFYEDQIRTMLGTLFGQSLSEE